MLNLSEKGYVVSFKNKYKVWETTYGREYKCVFISKNIKNKEIFCDVGYGIKYSSIPAMVVEMGKFTPSLIYIGDDSKGAGCKVICTPPDWEILDDVESSDYIGEDVQGNTWYIVSDSKGVEIRDNKKEMKYISFEDGCVTSLRYYGEELKLILDIIK